MVTEKKSRRATIHTNGYGGVFTEDKWSCFIGKETKLRELTSKFALFHSSLQSHQSALWICLPWELAVAIPAIKEIGKPIMAMRSGQGPGSTPSMASIMRGGPSLYQWPRAKLDPWMSVYNETLIRVPAEPQHLRPTKFSFSSDFNRSKKEEFLAEVSEHREELVWFLDYDGSTYGLGNDLETTRQILDSTKAYFRNFNYELSASAEDIHELIEKFNSAQTQFQSFISNDEAIKKYKRWRCEARKKGIHPALYKSRVECESAERLYAKQLGTTTETLIKLTNVAHTFQRCLELAQKTDDELMNSKPSELKNWAQQQEFLLGQTSFSAAGAILRRRIESVERLRSRTSKVEMIEKLLAEGQEEECKLLLFKELGYVSPPNGTDYVGHDISKL